MRATCVALAVCAVLFSGACGADSSEDDGSTTTDIAPTATAQGSGGEPVGIIAIGHSGLTGASSDPARPGQAALENSWATGTVAEVNSVYQRLVAIRPEHDGHVANHAEGGSSASALAAQARLALKTVASPALVIIQTIDNDIRCDGSDAERIDDFGADVGEALRIISEASPSSRILIVSWLGRPARYAAAVASDPEAFGVTLGTGMCDLFNPSGELVEANVATLTSIVELYEAEQSRVCADFPQCNNDGGVLTTFEDRAEDIVPKDGHLTVNGNARVAELIWPTVARILELE